MLENEVKNAFLNIIDAIDTGNSRIDEDNALEIIDLANKLTNTENKLSKYQARKYLNNMSRATFDNWVQKGIIPKGRKEQGFKELFWYTRDLQEAKDLLKTKKK